MGFYREANHRAQHGFNCHCCVKLIPFREVYTRMTSVNDYKDFEDWKLCRSCGELFRKICEEDDVGVNLDELRDAWEWEQDRKGKQGKK